MKYIYTFGDLLVKPDKSRYVWLYLPSQVEKARWTELAVKAKVPLSKFIIEIVENSLAEESDLKPRGEMVKELSRIKEENKRLADDLRLKNIVLEKYENELKRYRSEAFLLDDFQGVRKYSKEIIALLKKQGPIDSYRLLEALAIDPKEAELVKGVSSELEALENYGLIDSTPRGWRWMG
jgi:predicted nuclease with TOPRIM domain